jgi:hypothetical protein
VVTYRIVPSIEAPEDEKIPVKYARDKPSIISVVIRVVYRQRACDFED